MKSWFSRENLQPQSGRTLRNRHGGSTVPAPAASSSNEGQKEGLAAVPSGQSATAAKSDKRKADKSLETALLEVPGEGDIFDDIKSLDVPDLIQEMESWLDEL